MIKDTPKFRAISSRVLLAVIGALYVAIGLSLTPPYPLADVVEPNFWRITFIIAGLATLTASAYPHPVPRWLSYITLLLVTFAAGSRFWVLLVAFDTGSRVWAWGIIVAWQLRDWLDVCRWR